MKKKLFLLMAFVILTPFMALGQTQDPEEDPFRNDPFFTKPLKDWFSPDEMIERVSQRSERILRDGGVDEGTRDVTGFSTNPGLASINQLYPNIRFNRVEALYLGFHSDRYLDWGRKNHRGLNPYWSIGYSFGRKDWLYSVGIERLFGVERRFLLGASHQRITDSEDQWRVGWIENSLFSFFSVHDFMDYHARIGTRIYAVYKPAKMLELTGVYTDDMYTSLIKNTGYSVFGNRRDVRENAPIDEGKIQMIKAGVQFNPDDYLLTSRFGFSADIVGEFSDLISNNSDYAYDRVQGEVRTTIVLDPSAVLQNRLRMVSVTGIAPDFKYQPLGGIGTMRATAFKSMHGSHSVLFNSELHLGLDIGSYYMNDDIEIDLRDFRFILFADMGWTNGQPAANRPLMEGFETFRLSDMKTDLGFGVNFSAMRVEAAWNSSDLTTRPVIWVRFNSTF